MHRVTGRASTSGCACFLHLFFLSFLGWRGKSVSAGRPSLRVFLAERTGYRVFVLGAAAISRLRQFNVQQV